MKREEYEKELRTITPENLGAKSAQIALQTLIVEILLDILEKE